jgi:hypothetical protein
LDSNEGDRMQSQYPALADRFSLAGRYEAEDSLVQPDEHILYYLLLLLLLISFDLP